MQMFEEEIDDMKKNVKQINNEQRSLAYELILELKKRAKRDFIIIIVLICTLFLSNIAWFLYTMDLDYSYEEITQEQENTTNSYMNGEIN